MTVTKKGYELAAKLAPAIGYTNAISETCSKICRAAATLHRLNEDACNGHPANGHPAPSWAGPDYWQNVAKMQEKWEERVDRETERILARLDSLVRDLPATDEGPFILDAESDPRGCSVIIAPEDSGIRGDSWGDRNGICIP